MPAAYEASCLIASPPNALVIAFFAPRALRAALDDGQVARASLDVADPEPLPAGHWLYTHPKVANAAVIGLPDPKAGEKVKAFIQLKADVEATEEEFMEWCKTNISGYKRPREIESREELPISVVAKILRRVLKEEELKKTQST